MSTTTEAIEIIDGLVKAKVPKAVATKLVDFAEKQRDRGIDRLWIAMGIGFSIMALLLAGLWGDIRSTKQELKAEMSDIRSDMKDIRTEQREQRKLLLQILQKK